MTKQSSIFLATDPFALAEELAAAVEQQIKSADFFTPIPIVVPNRYLGKWLRLWLARKHGFAINLRITFLETALWDMLKAIDPRTPDAAPELLDGGDYRLLVLAVLLGENDPELAPLYRYIGTSPGELSRSASRRAWALADRLSGLIRDYEYHRQERFIQPWIENLYGRQEHATAGEYDRSQRALFQHIIRDPGGKRDLLNKALGANRKTLPQYAMELAEIFAKPDSAPPVVRGSLPSTWHLFGITQVSALHHHTLQWLARSFEFRFYHLNPLVGKISGAINRKAIEKAALTIRGDQKPAATSPGQELLLAWGSAGAESLLLLAEHLAPPSLSSGPAFSAKLLDSIKEQPAQKKTATVLSRLQQHLLSRTARSKKLAQDGSLQIVGCPGRIREVETVYNSILYNLAKDPSLQQTDIAVLTTDMGTYRPLIQAVFDRPPRRLTYNLADYSAAGLSSYGQAFLGMLDLALESFSRSRVFDVMLNHCFLARLGVERAQASTWLYWAEQLGIHQGWDEAEKKERGYADSPLFGWRLGLRRLRLGRFMETTTDDASRPPPRFGNVIPFADIDSADREQLDAFSRAVDGLLPELVRLRHQRGGGRAWANLLRRLGQTFLEVPADRPEEGRVRDSLYDSLEHLAVWDSLFGDDRDTAKPALSLPLVREFVQSSLETIEGSHGEYLTGGVIISALQPMRPVPFPIIYVLGLGEDLFPGSNRLSTLDLRSLDRLKGDILPAENARFLFLETLLAARDKCYLLYNNRDLQKDQTLLPAVPVLQLKRYLSEHIVGEEFKITEAPLHYHDAKSVQEPKPSEDALAHFDRKARLLGVTRARDEGKLSPDLFDVATIEDEIKSLIPDFTLPADRPASEAIPAVSVRELGRFLEDPAKAGLKRHLRLEEEEEQELVDDEPFVTPTWTARRLMTNVLTSVVRSATEVSVDQALAAWPDYFARLYEDWRLCSRLPEGAFGEVDEASLKDELQQRIDSQLVEFLHAHPAPTFCGPVLLGESFTPIGARRRFPALKLTLPRAVPGLARTEARLSGSIALAWYDDVSFDILILSQSAKVDNHKLTHHLFEPVLMYLALRAQHEARPDGISGKEWLSGRALKIYLSYRERLVSFTYLHDDITDAEALAYLGELTADFLDPTAFDLLPFDVISKEFELNAAFSQRESASRKRGYSELLEEMIDEDRERAYRRYSISELVELADAKVPADAYDKVHRRFRFLDLGPARSRRSDDA